MSANQQPSVSNQDEDPLLSDEDDEENEDQLESSNSGSSELHIVGEILRRRYRKRRYELKIRWYEHGEESDTWEDELNLIESGGSEVLKMIADFKEEQKRREKQKREERKFWVTVDSENEDEHQHEDEEYFGEKLSEAKREKKKLYDPTRKASETEKLLSILSNQKRLTRKAMNQMLDEPSSRSAVEANGNSRDNEREEPAPASPANRGRGRPRVSKTAPAPIDNVSPKRGRGRPRGSNNKKFFSPTKMNRSLRSCRTAPESDNIAEEFLQAAGAEEADDGHDELQLEDIEGSNAHQGGQLTFVEDDAHEDNDVARHEEREAHEEVDLQINVDNGTATDDATAFRPFHEGDHRRRHRDAPEDDRDHHLGNMMFGRRRNNRNSGNSRRPYQGRPSSSWESNEGNNQSRREDGNNHCEFGPPEGDTGTVSNWLPVTVTLPMYGTSGPSHSRSGSRSASPEMEATQRRISTTKKTVRFPEQLKEVYEFERDDSDASDDMESDRDERHEDEGASDSDDGEESDSTDVEVLDPVNEDFLIDGTDFHGEDPHDSIDMLGPIGMADQGDLYDCERLVVYDWKDFKKQAVSKNMPQPTLERVISIVEQRFPHQMECAISNDRDEKMKEYLMYTLPNGNNFLHELCSSPCDLELKHVADDLITMICRAAQIRGRLLSQKNAQGYTPLHLAVYVGADCYVKSLLKQKAPLELLDEVGRTPLHAAFDRDDVTIMERLLRGGANFEHFGCLQRRIGNTSTPGFATLERFSNKFRSLLHTARHEVYNGFEEVEVVSPVFTIQPHKMEAHFIFEHEAYQLHSDYEYLLFFFVCNMEEDEWTARCCNVGPAAPLVFQEGSPAINGIQCYTGPDSSNWPMIFNPVFGDDVKHTISVVLKERKSLVVALQVVLVKIVDQ